MLPAPTPPRGNAIRVTLRPENTRGYSISEAAEAGVDGSGAAAAAPASAAPFSMSRRLGPLLFGMVGLYISGTLRIGLRSRRAEGQGILKREPFPVGYCLRDWFDRRDHRRGSGAGAARRAKDAAGQRRRTGVHRVVLGCAGDCRGIRLASMCALDGGGIRSAVGHQPVHLAAVDRKSVV